MSNMIHSQQAEALLVHVNVSKHLLGKDLQNPSLIWKLRLWNVKKIKVTTLNRVLVFVSGDCCLDQCCCDTSYKLSNYDYSLKSNLVAIVM